MPLVAPAGAFGRRPERLMIFGPSTGGKTHDVLAILDLLRQFGTDFKCFYLDSDEAVPANIDHYPELEEQAEDLIDWTYATRFADAEKWARDLLEKKKPRPQDIIVVDRTTTFWDDAPRHYVKSRLKLDLEEMEREYRLSKEGGKDGNALLPYYSGGINPMWAAFRNRLFECKCHVIFVCTEKDLITKEGRMKDDGTTIRTFQKAGCKPDTQKKDHTFFHSIYFITQPHNDADKYITTTIRERKKRPKYTRHDITGASFGHFWLMGICGWTISANGVAHPVNDEGEEVEEEEEETEDEE